MNGKRLANRIINECVKMGAEDVSLVDARKKTPFFDFIVIATVDNPVLAEAILRNVDKSVEPDPGVNVQTESSPDSNWFVLDYGDLLFHLFVGSEIRERYDLEALWSQTPHHHAQQDSCVQASSEED